MIDLQQGVLEEFAARAVAVIRSSLRDHGFESVRLGADREDFTKDRAAQWLGGNRREVLAYVERRQKRLAERVAALVPVKNKSCAMCGAAFGNRTGACCSVACSRKRKYRRYYAANTELVRSKGRAKFRRYYEANTELVRSKVYCRRAK